MQLATLLYNDRVATWRQMKRLDESLEREPTERDVLRMAELRERNLMAFAELRELNDRGRFLCRHPLARHRSERARLERLRREDPAGFLRRYKNCADSVRRYEGYLRRPDRADRRDSDRQLLRKHRERETLFKSIISSTD